MEVPVARKLDSAAAATHPPLSLPYRDDVVSSLVRVMSVWTSSSYQRQLSDHAELPRDDNAIPALYRLAAAGPLRPTALAGELHISAPAASRLLDRLAEAGLARRVADPADSRASIVTLTDAGARVARDLFAAGDDLMTGLLKSWSSTDRDALARLLHRLADAVENDAAERGA